jgi:hypothetical protein
VAGLDRRIEALEKLYGSEGGEERSANGAGAARELEKSAQDFEWRVERLKSAAGRDPLGGLDITELRRRPPVEIAAVYVVLSQRGERAMARAVKDLYDDVKEERSRHPAVIELEEWSPGTGRAYDRWFWEMVERHAQSL